MTATDPPIAVDLDLLDLVPDPSAIHERLFEIARARRVLRRQLKLSLDARRKPGSARPAASPPAGKAGAA